MESWLVEIVALALALGVGAGLIAGLQRAIRARSECISILIEDHTTTVYDSNGEQIVETQNILAVAAGEQEPAAFGQDAKRVAAEKGHVVVYLGRGSTVNPDHWRSLVGYVLLQAIQDKPARARGLDVAIRLDLADEKSRTAVINAVTPRSMRAFGTIRIVQ